MRGRQVRVQFGILPHRLLCARPDLREPDHRRGLWRVGLEVHGLWLGREWLRERRRLLVWQRTGLPDGSGMQVRDMHLHGQVLSRGLLRRE